MTHLTRQQQTIILLRSRHDWQPGVRSQFSSFGATPGEKATVWRLCPSCDGAGTLTVRKGEEPCPKCSGRGRFLVDAYTGRRDSETAATLFEGAARSERGRKTDAEIERLKAQTEPPRSERDLIAEATPYGWERERDRHFRAGSYRELDQALEWLSQQNPQARALVGWVYESGADTLGCLHASILRAADVAVVLVAARLPDPIKVPHWLLPKSGASLRHEKKHGAEAA